MGWITKTKDITISQSLKQIEPEGNLVYKYAPLRVLKTSKSVSRNDLETPYEDSKIEHTYKVPAGGLIDLDTEDFNFSMEHPVDIKATRSYDGSVDLLLNDGYNIPRLINTGFVALDNTKYRDISRNGNSNNYNDSYFDIETSLYKKTANICKLEFIGLETNGNFKVGNYTFYFKLADADGNETDYVAESGMVSCYIGNINDPQSIRGGIEDENSFKAVHFKLTNIDKAYTYVTVYYTRTTGVKGGDSMPTFHYIKQSFNIYDGDADILLSGYEDTELKSLTDLNTIYNYVDTVQSTDFSQNRLFLANISRTNPDYTELIDIALRFKPFAKLGPIIGDVKEDYSDPTGKFEYYNANNIYNYVGYWDDEYYRFGVVFIFNDGTLSPAFDVRGYIPLTDNDNIEEAYPFYNIKGAIKERNYIPVIKNEYILKDNSNNKGVVRFKLNKSQFYGGTHPLGIGFKIESEVIEYAKSKNLFKGFFFVRQKRLKTILCQMAVIGLNPNTGIPMLPLGYETYTEMEGDSTREDRYGEVIGLHETEELTRKKYLIESITSKGTYKRIYTYDLTNRHILDCKDSWVNGGLLVNAFYERMFYTDKEDLSVKAALCPEYDVRQAFYNNFFTGSKITLTTPNSIYRNEFFNDGGSRSFYLNEFTTPESYTSKVCNITGVSEFTVGIKGKNQVFSSQIGDANDWQRFHTDNKLGKVYSSTSGSSEGMDQEDYTIRSGGKPVVRGLFGPYLGIEGDKLLDCSLWNIRIPGYSEEENNNYISIRANDKSLYYSISDRMSIEDLENGSTPILFRGDCFICNFTHRMNRNFQDPEAPNNDIILDKHKFNENYSYGDRKGNNKNINRNDINAIQLGHWATIKVCSSINLSLRDIDGSIGTEVGLTGNKRSFYPLTGMSASGDCKIPDSDVINTGYEVSIPEKSYVKVEEVPYINTDYTNRILFSDVAIDNGYKNNYRVFKNLNYRDYSTELGDITKIVALKDYIFIIHEHGCSYVSVNQKTAISKEDEVLLDSASVLPVKPTILSDMYGSLWHDSIIATEQSIFGVDTVSKKIWEIKLTGKLNLRWTIVTISDFKVQKWLNDNINLTELDKTVFIGLKNVKTHYNAFKHDVLFTFYNKDKIWNICYNELLEKFITFYSWVPVLSVNSDNVYYSFDSDDIRKPTDHSYIWKHGTAGNFEETLTHCNWYGKQHPFEFEVVVADSPTNQKIFNDLQIIANKTEPESFHYEITGDSYDFSNDKQNMYFRQEALKYIYNAYDADITYDVNFDKVFTEQRNIKFSNYKDKSTAFPLYYSRIDTVNDIEDYYQAQSDFNKDYHRLSGSEIVYDNYEYKIATHIKGCNFDSIYYQPISKDKYDRYKKYPNFIIGSKNITTGKYNYDIQPDGVTNIPAYFEVCTYNRRNGNMNYQEDKWLVQIPSIIYSQKNETPWFIYKGMQHPPINVANNPLPEGMNTIDLKPEDIESKLPKLYNLGYDFNNQSFDTEKYKSIKETRLRDKYIRIKVRYEGSKLAIIHSLLTLYTISYA